jgi:hypothetical protein
MSFSVHSFLQTWLQKRGGRNSWFFLFVYFSEKAVITKNIDNNQGVCQSPKDEFKAIR